MKKENLSLNTYVRTFLKPLLTFKMKEHARYSKNNLLDVLIETSLLTMFTEGISNALNKYGITTPNGDTVLMYLKSQTTDRVEEMFFNQVQSTVKVLKISGKLSRPVAISMDWTDLMFHGDHTTPMVIGTKHKDGSNYAYEYLTASLIVNNERIILGVVPVDKRYNIGDLTIKLIKKIKDELRIKIESVVFDRGFFILKLIKFLEDNRINYILRISKTKITERMRLESGDRGRYKTNSNGNSGRSVYNTTFDVVCVYDEIRDQRYYLATNIQLGPLLLLKKFKLRSAIETTYRISNQFLIKTTSKNWTVRLFFYLFACLMQNVWVLMNFLGAVHTTVTEMKVVFLHELAAVTYIRNLNVSKAPT